MAIGYQQRAVVVNFFFGFYYNKLNYFSILFKKKVTKAELGHLLVINCPYTIGVNLGIFANIFRADSCRCRPYGAKEMCLDQSHKPQRGGIYRAPPTKYRKISLN